MKYRYNYKKNATSIDKKSILIVIAVIFLAIILSLFLFRNNPVIQKINNVLTTPFKMIANSKLVSWVNEGIKTNGVLKEENEILKSKNSDLSLKLIEYEKLMKENESLRKQLDIKSAFQHYKLVTSKIILRSYDSYNITFEIDAGSQSGVKIGNAVIHENGLVGYISNITENTSTVVTILDPKTSVSVKMQSVSSPSLLTGSLEMKINNTLKLESIEIGAEVSISDILYTSGLGNMYPGSIPVAKIEKIENKKTESERYAICSPLVDISNINEVAVIIGEE